jgi:hypothetical protein
LRTGDGELSQSMNMHWWRWTQWLANLIKESTTCTFIKTTIYKL